MNINYFIVKNYVKVGDDFLVKEKTFHTGQEVIDYISDNKAYNFKIQVVKSADKKD